MKNLFLFLLMAVVLFGLPQKSCAGEADTEGSKTLSPYFFVKSDDASIDQLPLKSTAADVVISGVIADVTVRQTYANEGKHPLEAVYVFPASTRAAVYAMRMTIGERKIEAVIRKREEARQEYEKARSEGKSASLLEQHRPNVFQMNVANIMPGDTVKVELKYTELIVPEDKVYEFVYPTVVGPRYAGQPSGDARRDSWVQNPYLHQGQLPATTFDINVTLATGLPLRQASVETHKVAVSYADAATAHFRLDPSERHGGNRDFILRYRLDGDRIASGLLLHEGEKENFFLLMMQPPKRVRIENIPKREYIFIVDISGSMHGYPLETSKKLLRDLIGSLRPTDTFNVLLFAGSSSVLAEHSLAATPANIHRAIAVIDQQQGGGGTELVPALRKALSLPRTENSSRTVIIATDGYVSVEAEAFDVVRNNLGHANFFAFGIGTAVNRMLIEGLARAGMGEPFVITKPEEAAHQAERFRKMVESPVLTGIKTDFGRFDVYDVEPLNVPDVLAERPVIMYGKWRGSAKGTIRIKGMTGAGEFSETIDVGEVKERTNPALRYLWARQKIAALSDYNFLHGGDPRIDQVTDLGLKYNLLTAYTSFVAVDSEVRNKGGEGTTVKQPLPLPEGVSDYAVGNGQGLGFAAAPMAAPAPMKWDKAKRAAEPWRVTEAKEEEAQPAVTIVEISDPSRRSAAEDAFRARVAEIASCGGGEPGKMVFTITIDASGIVKDVMLKSTSGKGRELEKCLKTAAKKWRFPKLGNLKIKVQVMLGS